MSIEITETSSKTWLGITDIAIEKGLPIDVNNLWLRVAYISDALSM